MTFTLDELVAALDVTPEGSDNYRGSVPAAGWRRVFGGLVVAQALAAAQRTSQDRPVHALHANFIRPGHPATAIVYEVERLRDGGSFSTRRCIARQDGELIFAMSASFHRSEGDGFDHALPMPEVPGPEDALALDGPAGLQDSRLDRARAFFRRQMPIEVRPFVPDPAPGSSAGSRRNLHVWMRAASALPDDPSLHAAVLAYMSDIALLEVALSVHGRSVFDPDLQVASLDHAVWFHRAMRADAWLLYVADSPSAAGARGFTRGQFYDRAGRLVASTAQEGLIRPRTPSRLRD